MAPFFGSSTVIWANTIAVVLLALSVGYWLGGRLADRRPTRAALCATGAGRRRAAGVVPFIAHPFLSLSVEAFDELLGGRVRRLAVRDAGAGRGAAAAARRGVAVGDAAEARAVEEAGAVAGRLYAISTVGSLVGVFFVVAVGDRGDRHAADVPRARAGARRPSRRSALRPALRARAARARGAAGPARRDDQAGRGRRACSTRPRRRTSTRAWSRRRTARGGSSSTRARRSTRCWRPGTVLTGGYWDGFLVLPFAPARAAAGADRGARHGGGTVPRAYAHYFPDTRDRRRRHRPASCSRSGAATSGCSARPQLRELAEDARPFLRRTDERYDSIFVDAYRQPYIPFYLTTREFFALVRDRLRPGRLGDHQHRPPERLATRSRRR